MYTIDRCFLFEYKFIFPHHIHQLNVNCLHEEKKVIPHLPVFDVMFFYYFFIFFMLM